MKRGNISVGSAGCLAPWQDFSCSSVVAVFVVIRVFTLMFTLFPEEKETYNPHELYCRCAI